MNGVAPKAPWSRRQWVGWIAASFAAHLGLIWLLAERPGLPPPSGPRFQATLAESLSTALARLPEFDDPALFALPSARGFSGAGWMRLPPLEHQYHEWTEDQRWLMPSASEYGQAFVSYVRAATSRPLAMTEMSPPEVAAPEIPARPDWLPQRSTLRITGLLAARRLLRQPALPVWPGDDVLARTEVQVMVDERGRVIAANLLAECGLPAADRRAVDLARECAFAQMPNAGLTVGNLVFEWATVSATNAPANSPVP